MAGNPMLHANVTALSSMEPQLSPVKFLHCKNRKFCAFCCCDIDLDPMTFIYELDLYLFKISPQTKNELSTWLSKYVRTYIGLHTYKYIHTLWTKTGTLLKFITPVCDDVRGVQYYQSVQLFIRSNSGALNVAIFKYSLETFRETKLHWKSINLTMTFNYFCRIPSELTINVDCEHQ